jgi:hypothetical protein
MPRLIDSDRQAAIRDVMNSRRVITVSDAEMIGALLGVPGSVILSDVQAIKESATRGLLVVLKLSIAWLARSVWAGQHLLRR